MALTTTTRFKHGLHSETLAEKCLFGMTANKEYTEQMVMNSIGLITFLILYIGHAMGDQIGEEAMKTGKSIRALVLEKGLLYEKDLDRILSKENLMHPEFGVGKD